MREGGAVLGPRWSKALGGLKPPANSMRLMNFSSWGNRISKINWSRLPGPERMKSVVCECGHAPSCSWASFIPSWNTREVPENVPEGNEALAGAVPTAQPECGGWRRQ